MFTFKLWIFCEVFLKSTNFKLILFYSMTLIKTCTSHRLFLSSSKKRIYLWRIFLKPIKFQSTFWLCHLMALFRAYYIWRKSKYCQRCLLRLPDMRPIILVMFILQFNQHLRPYQNIAEQLPSEVSGHTSNYFSK